LAALGLFLVFVIIPVVVKMFGYDSIIYLNHIQLKIIVLNLIYILLFLIFCYVLKIRKNKKFKFKSPFKLIRFSSFIIIIWVISFSLLGGFVYRKSDVNFGASSRGLLLDFVLSLYNVMIVLALSILNRLYYTKSKVHFLGVLSILSFLTVVIISGSRGIVVQFILSAIFLFIIRIKEFKKKSRYYNLIFTKKNIVVFVMLIIGFSLVGYYRDNQTNLFFEFLFRSAEPYWYMSFIHANKYGGDILLLSDSFHRVVYIITRYLGSQISGTIEGSDFYLSNYLGFIFKQGKSLPITLFGFGYLINELFGVPLVLLITATLIKLGFSLSVMLSKKIIWGYEYLIYFATSCLLIYSKSLSGVFQLLIYEKIRDFLFLMILTLIWIILSKRSIT